MGEGEPNVVPKQPCSLLRKGGILQQLRQPRQLCVGEELGGFGREKPGGGQNVKPFSPIKAKNGADAVEHVPADSAVARFQAAQRAVVDFRKPRNFFLGQVALVA